MKNLTAKKGIWNITGEIGAGKTSFATACGVPPEQIAFLNWDVKDPGIDGLGHYSTYSGLLATGNELEMVNQVFEDLKNLGNAKKFKVLILDNWELLFKSLPAFVFTNANKLKKRWSPSGKFANMQKIAYAKTVEAAQLERVARGFDLVFVINHLTPQFVDDVRTGKEIPNASQRLAAISRCRLWFRTNPLHPMPIGLVLKNLGKSDFKDGRIQTVNVLPERLDQQVFPDWKEREYISPWDIVDHYIENPVGPRPLVGYESATEFERSLIYGTYTQEQLETIEFGRQMKLKEASEGLETRVKEIMEQGVTSAKVILDNLSEEFPTAKLPDIMKAMKGE